MFFLQTIWAKFATYIAAASAVVAFLLGLRYKIRSDAKSEVENKMRELTIERIEKADDIRQDIDSSDDDDVVDRMRNNNWFR